MKQSNSVSGGLHQTGGRQLQRKPERKIKEPQKNENTLETQLEQQCLIPALKIKFYNKRPFYRYADTVLPNCISYFPSDRVFFLNQTNIWHFQTLNVCQSVYKILLHYHLINIFLNSRAIENFVNSLLTILAIILFNNFSISFFFFFFSAVSY